MKYLTKDMVTYGYLDQVSPTCLFQSKNLVSKIKNGQDLKDCCVNMLALKKNKIADLNSVFSPSNQVKQPVGGCYFSCSHFLIVKCTDNHNTHNKFSQIPLVAETDKWFDEHPFQLSRLLSQPYNRRSRGPISQVCNGL